MKTSLFRYGLFILPLLIATLIGVTGCGKPNFTGANQAFVTSGSADDGDDQTTGPAKTYTNPARTIADGLAVATSAPQSYRSLRGEVTAQTGAQPTRISTALATNKATSTFVVTKPVTFKFELSTTASATLNSGEGGYLVAARILDAQGVYVPNSDFQTRYDFKENATGGIDVSQDGQLFTQIANGGVISPIDTGPQAAIQLPAGTYTLMFELNIDAKADTSASLRVSGTVDPK